MRASVDDLDGLINPLALTSSITRLLISVYLGSLETKFGKNAKLAYLIEIFVEAFLAIKPAI